MPSMRLIGLSPLLVLGILTGCGSESSSYVYVSQPEIFTRERLIDERLRETQFLEAKLDPKNAPTFGFQGLSDRSIVNYFMNQLTLQFNPAGQLGGGTAMGGNTKDKGNNGGGTTTPATMPAGNSVTINNTNTNSAYPADSGKSSSPSTDASSGSDKGSGGGGTGGTGGTGGSGSGGSGGTTGKGAKSSDGTADASGAGNSGKSSATPAVTDTWTPPATMPSGKDAATTTAQLDPIQKLEDQTSFRDAVNSLIQEKMLDDTHDLRGLTLYTLKFDLTVVPGSNAHRPLIVLLELDDKEWVDGADDPSKGGDSRYANWVRALDQEIQLETQKAEARLLQDRLTSEDFSQIVAALSDGKHPAINYPGQTDAPKHFFDDALKAFTAFELRGTAERFNLLQNDVKTRALVKYAVAVWVAKRYEQLTSMVDVCVTASPTTLGPPASAPKKGKDQGIKDWFFIVTAQSNQQKQSVFYRAINSLGNSLEPRGFAIEPKTYAQNISDVSARRDILDLSLAVSAAFKGVNVGDTARSFNQSQSLLQTIKRQPLAIGFGTGRRQFGWLLGPSFIIDTNLKAQFQHAPVRQTFSAEIGVPAWWSAAGLTGHCYWLEDNGTLTPATTPPPGSFWGQSGFNSQIQVLSPGDIWPALNVARETPHPVTPDHYSNLANSGILQQTDEGSTPKSLPSTTFLKLPTDPAAITTALVYRNDRTQRVPVLEPVWQTEFRKGSAGPGYTIQAKTPDQIILLRGRDLWRNPQVYIGSFPATRIEVNPDMNGLLAHFDDVPVPLASGNPLQELRVVTTFGSDYLPACVEVKEPPKPKENAPFLSLDQHWVVVADGGEADFTIDPTKESKAALATATLFIKAHQAPVINLSPQPTSLKLKSPTLLTIRLPSDILQPAKEQPLQKAAFDVDVRANELDTIPSILTDPPQTVVVFATKADRSLSFDQTDSAQTPAKQDGATTKQSGEKGQPGSPSTPPTAGANPPAAAASANAPVLTVTAAKTLNLSITLPTGDDVLLLAYPELGPAIESKSAFTLRLTPNDATPILSGTFQMDSNGRLISPTFPSPPSAAKDEKLQYEAEVRWTDTKGKEQSIPVKQSLKFNSAP